MRNYKYMPESFKGVQFIEDELIKFYMAYEIFRKNSSELNRAKLQNAWAALFLTIKQREVGGQLRKDTASDMREYIERLTYD